MDPIFTNRINYDEITEAFSALRERATACQDLAAFIKLIDPVANRFIERYWHLLAPETYREGEFAGLCHHITTCIEFIMPPHLPFLAIWGEKEIVFVPRSPDADPGRKD